MRVVYKLALFILLFNLSVATVARVTGTPPAAPVSSSLLPDTSAQAETATSNVQTAVASQITGWIYTIPVLGDFIALIKPVLYIEDTLSQPPFNLGFEIMSGVTFAHAIQVVIWMVYTAAIIDMFMKTRITRD